MTYSLRVIGPTITRLPGGPLTCGNMRRKRRYVPPAVQATATELQRFSAASNTPSGVTSECMSPQESPIHALPGSQRQDLCYRCYITPVQPTVSHRDLRNNSGAVLHAVEKGESYTVTNHGKPVARLVPITEATPDIPLRRPATIQGGFSGLARHSIATPSAETLDDLRGDR